MRHKRILGHLHAGSGGGGSGATLATYNFTGTGWSTFGLALPQGSATGGVKVGGASTQTDVLRTWADGSIRHALVTANISGTGSTAITSDVHTAGSFTPTWPSASVVFVTTGGTFTSTLPSFTSADSFASGPNLRESRVTTAFTGGTGAGLYALCCWYVRSYSDGTHQISVVLKNGDVDTAAADRVPMTSLTVTIAGSTVYSFTASTAANTLSYTGRTITSTAHGLVAGDTVELLGGSVGQTAFIISSITANTADTYNSTADGTGVYGFTTDQTNVSWRRILCLYHGTTFVIGRYNVSGFAEATYTPDLAPFYDAYALIQFGTGMSSVTYTDTGNNWALPGVGTMQIPLAGSTGDEQLGHYPYWVATWQEHLTQNQFDHMLRFADRAATLNGQYHRATTGAAIRHTDSGMANLTIHISAGTDRPANSMNGYGPYEFDPAHHGSHFYVPYIMTGRREYLDCMKGHETYTAATYNSDFFPDFANHRAQGRGGSSVFLGPFFGGARGWAWNMRGWSDLASCIPDADGDKSYFTTILTNNCTWAETYAAQLLADTNNVFGVMGSATEGYFGVLTEYTLALVTFVYQQAYLAFGMHRCKQHGFMSTSALRNALGKTELLRIQSNPDYDRSYGDPYNLAIGRQGVSAISTVSATNPATIEVRGAHALTSGDSITIAGTDSTPSVDGTYTVTVLDLTRFTVPVAVTVGGTINTGSISGMPCPGGSVMTNNAGSTTPFVYYSTWAQVWEATKDSWGNVGAVPGDETYAAQQYFLVQCADQAGYSGSGAALTFAAGYAATATYGPFSLARF